MSVWFWISAAITAACVLSIIAIQITLIGCVGAECSGAGVAFVPIMIGVPAGAVTASMLLSRLGKRRDDALARPIASQCARILRTTLLIIGLYAFAGAFLRIDRLPPIDRSAVWVLMASGLGAWGVALGMDPRRRSHVAMALAFSAIGFGFGLYRGPLPYLVWILPLLLSTTLAWLTR